jgi:hypothetical protein
MNVEVVGDLAAEVAAAAHAAAAAQLERRVETLLKAAYPVTASLPRAELRRRLKDAEIAEAHRRRSPDDDQASGGSRGGGASGVLGRQLSRVPRAAPLPERQTRSPSPSPLQFISRP